MEKKIKTKETKTIKVDKDFLMTVLKELKNLKGEFTDLKQGIFKPKEVPFKPEEISPTPKVPKIDYIFQCMETLSLDRIPPTPGDIVIYSQRSQEFREEIEALMKKHKVVQATAMFLKKL